jgi:hypothetical protein
MNAEVTQQTSVKAKVTPQRDILVERVSSIDLSGLFTFAGDNSNTTLVAIGDTISLSGNNGISTSISNTDVITIILDDTGVSSGTYGSSTQAVSITVDTQGRITSISNTNITGAGGGSFANLTHTHTISDITDVDSDLQSPSLHLVLL